MYYKEYLNLITIPVLNINTKLWDMKFREKSNDKWLNLSFVKYDDAMGFYVLACQYFTFKELKKSYNINTEEQYKR